MSYKYNEYNMSTMEIILSPLPTLVIFLLVSVNGTSINRKLSIIFYFSLSFINCPHDLFSPSTPLQPTKIQSVLFFLQICLLFLFFTGSRKICVKHHHFKYSMNIATK